MSKGLIILFVAVLVSGCSTVQSIQYYLDDVTPGSRQLTGIKVKVVPIVDARKNSKKNDVLFTSDNNRSVYQDKTVCLNSEKHYETATVSSQITDMLIGHILKKYPDIEIVTSDNVNPDFEISGEIGDFFAAQKPSVAVEVGAQFGLIGALATAGTKTRGEVAISFDKVVIKDTSGAVVADIGTIANKWDDMFYIDAYCWAPYGHVNQKLKLVIEELVDVIGMEIGEQLIDR